MSFMNGSLDIRHAPENEGKYPHLCPGASFELPSARTLAVKRYLSFQLYCRRAKYESIAHSDAELPVPVQEILLAALSVWNKPSA